MRNFKVPIANTAELPDLAGLYTAPIHGPRPGAMGYFELGTGRLACYNDGGEWFFEAGTGTPTFYIKDRAIHFASQTCT
jgi:hypothetical protein